MQGRIDALLWLKEIEKIKQTGAVICPLMVAHPAHFPATICACDIPSTRSSFFGQNPEELLCSVASECLPTTLYPDEAGEERAPRPSPRQPRPKGSWVAAFGNN